MRSYQIGAAVAALAAALTFGSPAIAKPEAAKSHHGGQHAAAQKTIVETAAGNPDFSTLVAAVQAAGLVDTLSGAGPFTVFAPTNAAFAKLPAGTVDTLVQPANRATLTSILTYHVVAGRVNSTDLIAQIRSGGGHARLTTVEGDTLTATLDGDKVKLTDARGGNAYVTAVDLQQSNGVIHVIDTVVMPAA